MLMSKYEQAEYLANLIVIMENKKDGGLPKGNTLTKEYTLVYNSLLEAMKKEHEDAARKNADDSRRNEGGTEGSSNRTGSGRQDRDSTADSADNPGSRQGRDLA